MEDNTKHLTEKWISFIKEVLQAGEIDLFILSKIYAANILPPGWSIQYSHSERRRFPLGQPNAHLHCSPGTETNSFDELRSTSLACICRGPYTPQGAGNLLLILHSVRFANYEQKRTALQVIFDLIDPPSFRVLTAALIRAFNTSYHFPSRSEYPDTGFTLYEDLFFQLQYSDHLNNPIYFLRMVLFSKREVPISFKVIASIAPEPRAAIAEFGLQVPADERTFLAFLQDHPEEMAFWAALMLMEQPSHLAFIGADTIRLFIENWETVGKHLFRKVYHNHKGSLEGIKASLSGPLNAYIFPRFFKVGETNTILGKIQFKRDLLTIGGWLDNIVDRADPFELNDSSVEQVGFLLATHLEEMSTGMTGYVREKNDSYQVWFDDMHDARTQRSLLLLVSSLICCEDRTWKSIERSFIKICHQIKLFYYGSYTPSRIAYTFSNHLLCFLLVFPEIRDIRKYEVSRLKKLMEIFSNLLAYPWVILTERKEIIWSSDQYKDNHMDAELSFILHKLQNVPEIYEDLFASFKHAVAAYATIPWPIPG